MSDAAIHVQGLSKRYRVWTHRRPTNLKERIGFALMRPVHEKPVREDIWALREVSFDVRRGEVFGVIGANGAGKSTLFAVLARITEPSGGYAEIRGRVSALLEVGTGFHSELSGRDNIFLNGAVLGMSRAETRQKFDEIVEFSELRDFIDMPVKRYSTGMYMRLAFAVAAHLDPEILLLDEVLSVGDAAFQRKSLERIQEMTNSGRTVLFVSHAASSVAELCDRALYLKDGRVEFVGDVDEALERYLSARRTLQGGGSLSAVDHTGSGEARFAEIKILSADGSRDLTTDRPVTVRIDFATKHPLPVHNLQVVLTIGSAVGGSLVTLATRLDDVLEELADGATIECTVDELPLQPGTYVVSAALIRHDALIDGIVNQVEFHLNAGDETPLVPVEHPAPVLVRQTWRVGDTETVAPR